MNGELFAVRVLAVLDLVLGNHHKLAAVVLHHEKELSALLDGPHRVHYLGIGDLNRSLGERLDVKIGARKLDALDVPSMAVQAFLGHNCGHVIE